MSTRVKSQFVMDYKGFCELICIDLDDLFPPKKYLQNPFETANHQTTKDPHVDDIFRATIEDSDLKPLLKEMVLKWRSLNRARVEITQLDLNTATKSLMTTLDPQKTGRIRKDHFIQYLNSLGCKEILPLVEQLDFPLTFSDLSVLLALSTSKNSTEHLRLRNI